MQTVEDFNQRAAKIAAARAMLAALERVTEYAERYNDLADNDDGCSKAIALAYAALAAAKAAGIKAEG